MVDLYNPTVIVDEYLAYMKLCHVLGGLYIWEFVTTLDYEWSVTQGRRPYRRTIWIYSFMRLSTLIGIILLFVSFNTTRPINCQLWVLFTSIFGCLSISAALLLIVLRTIAIWNMNKIVIVLSTGMWIVHLAFIIRAISQVHSSWSTEFNISGCSPANIENEKVAIIILCSSDLTLVSMMCLGLFRLRGRSGGMSGIGSILWKQGVIWVIFASGIQPIFLTFVCLDLSPIYNIMFLIPVQISMPITASRIYTSLTDFSSVTDVVMHLDLERGRRAISNANAKGMPVVRVHVDHTSEESSSTVTPPSATLCLDISAELCDKPQE